MSRAGLLAEIQSPEEGKLQFAGSTSPMAAICHVADVELEAFKGPDWPSCVNWTSVWFQSGAASRVAAYPDVLESECCHRCIAAIERKKPNGSCWSDAAVP